jgi:hypothetical protein
MNPRKPRFGVLGQIGALRRYARSLTRDATDAEDLVNDALVRAYERRTRATGLPLKSSLIALVKLVVGLCAHAGFMVLSAVGLDGSPHVGVIWSDRPKWSSW